MTYNALLVDDSGSMRKMLIETLRTCGLELGECYEASNGQEGLKVLKEKRVDFALVDVHMPLMGGQEMLERLRQDPEINPLPVIFVSCESSSLRIEILRKIGGAYVHKPVDPEALKEAVLNAGVKGHVE